VADAAERAMCVSRKMGDAERSNRARRRRGAAARSAAVDARAPRRIAAAVGPMMRPGVHIDARARSPRASRARGGDLPAPTPRAMPMNVWNSSVQSLGRRRIASSIDLVTKIAAAMTTFSRL